MIPSFAKTTLPVTARSRVVFPRPAAKMPPSPWSDNTLASKKYEPVGDCSYPEAGNSVQMGWV